MVHWDGVGTAFFAMLFSRECCTHPIYRLYVSRAPLPTNESLLATPTEYSIPVVRWQKVVVPCIWSYQTHACHCVISSSFVSGHSWTLRSFSALVKLGIKTFWISVPTPNCCGYIEMNPCLLTRYLLAVSYGIDGLAQGDNYFAWKSLSKKSCNEKDNVSNDFWARLTGLR